MKLRSFVFWPHLIAGVCAGVVILIMCVTGVLLTYERQLLAWADSGFRSERPASGAGALSMDALLAELRVSHPELTPTTVTVRADETAAVAVAAGGRTLYVDRYSGAVVGEASRGGIRGFMTSMRAWHRWLAVDGPGRPVARAITGWSNFLFLFIIATGCYLWLPRKWGWPQLRSILLFNASARGKARDFNWHNVIGIWSAVPLFVVVFSALPISFGWFNTVVYRAVGEAPPPPGQGRGGGPARAGGEVARASHEAAGGRQVRDTVQGATRGDVPARPESVRQAEGTARVEGGPPTLDPLWNRAVAQVPGWRSISLRVPASTTAPAVFTIDTGDGGQPHLRSTLTLDTRTGAVRSLETFSDLTLGRRIRTTMRFAHTGEVLGEFGQTIAGLASAGGAVLVWTGVALAWRRFRAWTGRRHRQTDTSRISTAA